MACNTCAKPFNLLRKEKGCPSCGFSYCSKCLSNKTFVQKLNSEVKVCINCKKKSEAGNVTVEPPDAYYKRVGDLEGKDNSSASNAANNNLIDEQIQERLKKLKQDKTNKETTKGEIEIRLQKLKGDIPSVTEEELQIRLANIKGIPYSTAQNKPVLSIDSRSEQEQVDDLLKQYTEQAMVNSKYKESFDEEINMIEARLKNLRDQSTSGIKKNIEPSIENDQEDEETTIKKIIEKVKGEDPVETDDIDLHVKELPFCEICNEDAKVRCLGCKYLYCKECYIEHIDDDDGCNRCETYNLQ